MAENNNNQNVNNSGDFNPLNTLRQNAGGSDYASISRAVADGMSQALRNYNPRSSSQSFFSDRRNEMRTSNPRLERSRNYRRHGNVVDDIEEGIKDELLDAFAGGDFKKSMQSALSEFTKQFGFELKDFTHEYGRWLGRQLADTQLGRSVRNHLSQAVSNWANRIFGQGAGSAITNAFRNRGSSGGSSGGSGNLTGTAGAALANMSQSGAAQSAASNQMFANLSRYAASAAAVAAIVYAAYKMLKPLLSGIAKVIQTWGKAFNRDEDLRQKRLENAKKRVEADLTWLAEEPFNILINAAKKWEDTWDANLSKISLTQGYTKEDVYDLYEATSRRLISEGLGSAIPATDVINNLGSILESGLSGKVAEEFAYQATKLSAAIPTENFIGYSSIYAQLASEAISKGISEQGALDYANSQLEQFASNLLYSSRTLTGGFTSGLKDAQSLFKEAVNISQAAKTYNASQISGTLTAVSGVIGAVAPDLASSLVQNVVNAAIGGNSDTIVALRSLAGINAGNTSFLQTLAKDPQGLFVTIFKNLANMQNMSPTNYMEVAEGLSSVFGVDMQAFARVDFNYLANKLAEMTVNTSSLDENMLLLQSGQATMSSEQLKLQEINNAILDEGLAYVIDSEAGRMVQQHMWDEQIANELANNEFTVCLQGAALTYLEGLRGAVANILNFLNPIGFLAKGIGNFIVADEERISANKDLAAILEKGAVGTNTKAFGNLVTTGQNLGLVRPLIELMGGTSSKDLGRISAVNDNVRLASEIGSYVSILFNGLGTAGVGAITHAWDPSGRRIVGGASWNAAVDAVGGLDSILPGVSGVSNVRGYLTNTSGNNAYGSLYSGFSVGKSALSRAAGGSRSLPEVIRNVAVTAGEAASGQTRQQLQEFISGIAEASKTQSWSSYKASARDYGIADIDQALKEFNITEESLKSYFESAEAMHGASAEQARKDDEQNFRDENRKFWDYAAGSGGVFQTAMWLPFLNDNFKPFFDPAGRYDTRMDLVDTSLSNIQLKEDDIIARLGDNTEFTVISVLAAINKQIDETFVRSGSEFQKCLADWARYIKANKSYKDEISLAQAWNDVSRAEGANQNETLLALANAMNVFSADELKKLDPQMQANALLGEIVILLQTMVQQNNTQAGGLSLIDTMSALGFGITNKTK